MKADYFVYPGQIQTGRHPCSIRTILGSCVAVTLVDRKARIIGLCHYLLDKALQGEKGGFRYGEIAIPALIEAMEAQGANTKAMEAQIFGGANLSANLASFHDEIGRANVEIARKSMEMLRIPVIHEDVGGQLGRNILLTSSDFGVVSNLIQKASGAPDVQKTAINAPDLASSARVLIVDDSQTARTVIEKSLSRAKGITIVGSAADAYEARDKIVALNPDVLLLDIEMPKMNGVQFLEKLMMHSPMPVIMVSSLAPDGKAALRALELGAVEFVRKPSQYDPNLLRDLSEILPPKILAAASTKGQLARLNKPVQSQTPRRRPEGSSTHVDMICISGNVGCIDSVARILAGLEEDSPPVVMAVSTASTVPAAFKQKISGKTRLTIIDVERPVTMSRGKVYLGPADAHISVGAASSGSLVAELVSGPAVQGQRPSGDVLMLSAARARPGGVCAILLGGFGKDGIRGLEAVLASGGFTIVESPDSAAFPHNINSALQNGAGQVTAMADSIAAEVFLQRSRTGA